MKFLDQAKIYIRSGDGGRGCIAFRREKFIAFGGPNGGDGGRGGDVVAVAVDNLNTLINFRYQQHFQAERGHDGIGTNRSGRKGHDVVLSVPVGTQMLSDDRTAVLADLIRPGQKVLLAQGGDGGFGNAHYKSATNRAPRHASPGWPGEERWLWLHLKLIADAGLVGLPNAGKSTFLAASTRAQPKIADYPFTTLHPYLGVAQVEGDEFVIADIPGLIKGAHKGAGLGIRFLGHVERCSILLHLVDGTGEDVAQAYRVVRDEIESYGHGLAEKAEIVALNKIDALPPERIAAQQATLAAAASLATEAVKTVSGVAGSGLKHLLKILLKHAIDKRENEKEERRA